jgi:phage shock protein A
MLIDILKQVHPEIIANTLAQHLVDRHMSGANWPLSSEIQTALEEYQARHSDDEEQVRAALTGMQEHLAYLIENRKDEILRRIEAGEARLNDLRDMAGELNAEVDRLLNREV